MKHLYFLPLLLAFYSLGFASANIIAPRKYTHETKSDKAPVLTTTTSGKQDKLTEPRADIVSVVNRGRPEVESLDEVMREIATRTLNKKKAKEGKKNKTLKSRKVTKKNGKTKKNTESPIISVPTTSAPIISARTTSSPTASVPTTSAPTKSAPTTSAPIISAPTPTTTAPTTSVQGKVYLALGDSLPAGTVDINDPEPKIFTQTYSENGYPYKLFKNYLQKERGFEKIYNLACPGESSTEMIDGKDSLCFGGNPMYAQDSPTISKLGTTISQLNSAASILTSQNVKLVTISLGGNDLRDNCDPTSADVIACVTEFLQKFAVNFGTILSTLRSQTDAPILITNLYLPYLSFKVVPGVPEVLLDLAETYSLAIFALNQVISQFVGNFEGVHLVDIETDFNSRDDSGNPPTNSLVVCKNTYMCVKENGIFLPILPPDHVDFHPNDSGHEEISMSHKGVLEQLLS